MTAPKEVHDGHMEVYDGHKHDGTKKLTRTANKFIEVRLGSSYRA